MPNTFLDSLEGLPGFDRKLFELAHAQEGQLTSIRINPAKARNFFQDTELTAGFSKIPWTEWGYYLDARPSFTFDPMFHAGAYYVQEASSMFVEQAIRQLTDGSRNLRVLDLSAAPGGKATHLQSLLPEGSLLVANEVIRNRAMILKENLIKWGSVNALVTNNDPSVFKKLKGFFDLILVDAPCSGSGLFRKDTEALNEWSLNNVALCSQRQQRILADVLPALKQDGLLIYATCSFSREEDEAIGEWLEEDFAMKGEQLVLDDTWGIVESRSGKNTFGYRFYPDKLKGEGFYLSCFRKTEEVDPVRVKAGKPEKLAAKDFGVLSSMVETKGIELVVDREIVYALPASAVEEALFLQKILNIQYWGTELGKMIRGKLLPEHALAMSPLLKAEFPSVDLGFDDAVKYLQRQEISAASNKMGWQTVNYRGYRLGWINALPNRINNYYPKASRILKQNH